MLNKLAKEIHEIAISKGWWEQERNPLEIHALIHSEISEATDFYKQELNAQVWAINCLLTISDCVSIIEQ